MKARTLIYTLVPVVVVAALAAGPATAGAAESADLATTVSPGWASFGGATMTVTVKNNGPSAAQNVTVTDSWYGGGGFWRFAGLKVTPAGVSCTTPLVGQWSPRVVTCSVASLGSGQSIVLGLSWWPTLFTGRGSVTDSATAASATPDPDSANNTASLSETA